MFCQFLAKTYNCLMILTFDSSKRAQEAPPTRMCAREHFVSMCAPNPPMRTKCSHTHVRVRAFRGGGRELWVTLYMNKFVKN